MMKNSRQYKQCLHSFYKENDVFSTYSCDERRKILLQLIFSRSIRFLKSHQCFNLFLNISFRLHRLILFRFNVPENIENKLLISIGLSVETEISRHADRDQKSFGFLDNTDAVVLVVVLTFDIEEDRPLLLNNNLVTKIDFFGCLQSIRYDSDDADVKHVQEKIIHCNQSSNR